MFEDLDDMLDMKHGELFTNLREAEEKMIEMKQEGLKEQLATLKSRLEDVEKFGFSNQVSLLENMVDISFGRYVKIVNERLPLLNLSHSKDFFSMMLNSVTLYISSEGDDDVMLSVKGSEMMLLAASCLLIFQQSNWTGPSIEDGEMKSISDIFNVLLPSKNESVDLLGKLAQQDDEFTTQSTYPYLLLAAVAIHQALAHSSMPVIVSSIHTLPLWHARTIVAFQQSLTSSVPSPSLKAQAYTLYEKSINRVKGGDNNLMTARVYLEYGMAKQAFDDLDGARLMFLEGHKSSGLELLLTGAMAKKTKYQSEGYASMVMQARSSCEENGVPESIVKLSEEDKKRIKEREKEMIDRFKKEEAEGEGEISKEENSLSLAGLREVSLSQVDPHTYLLDKQSFNQPQRGQDTLNRIDQIVLLSYCIDLRKNRPKDCLTNEEMIAHTERIQLQPRNWMIHSSALLLQCWCEFESHRKSERAVMQLEALVDQHTTQLTKTQFSLSAIENSAPNYERLQYLHALPFPPRWKLRMELAKRLAKLGILRSAVEIFLSLEAWDAVVDCYTVLEDRKKGVSLVKERLAIKETPKLLVSLGDLTGEVEHHEKAWSVSKQRYWPAAWRLARVEFNKGNFHACIALLTKATKINPLTNSLWFLMGSAAMRCGQSELETARLAFQRVVALDQEDGKAWGNLSAVLIKQGKSLEAFKATKEAIKHESLNWRMWDNLLTLSLGVKDYGYSIMCIERMLDLKAKEYVICCVTLQRLVKGIIDRDFNMDKNDSDISEFEDEDEIDLSINELNESDIISTSPPLPSSTSPIKDTTTSNTEKNTYDYAAAVEASRQAKGAYLEKKICELFGRITSKTQNNMEIWSIYSSLHMSLNNLDKAIDCKQRECRAAKVDGWERDVEKFERVSSCSLSLCEMYLKEGSRRSLREGQTWVTSIVKRTKDSFYLNQSHIALCNIEEKINQELIKLS